MITFTYIDKIQLLEQTLVCLTISLIKKHFISDSQYRYFIYIR